MKKLLALGALAVILPIGISTTYAISSVPISDIYKDYSATELAKNPKFGFMDFYYGESFENIQKQYTLEHEWGDRWNIRNMDLKGFLGFKKTGVVTLSFKDNKLVGINIFVNGDKRNIAMNLVKEFGAPVIQQRDPGRMQNYIWKRGDICIIYQHDDNEKNVMLDFCGANMVGILYK